MLTELDDNGKMSFHVDETEKPKDKMWRSIGL